MTLAVCSLALAGDFDWNWRAQETIGRNDPSVGTTSKLTEPERAALIDAIVLRLQKPMSERGYDDDRIREIASTTRLRFLDLGEGKALVFATSLGLEGGCDAMANCPLWIFRHTDDGYVSALDTFGASYTIQPTSSNGVSDLVIMRHESASESHLSLYSYADGKYSEAGCYIATWSAPNEGEIQDPEITACKSGDVALDQGKADESKPNDVTQGDVKTDDSKPNDVTQGDVKPDDSKPSDVTQGGVKPDDSKPNDVKPTDSKPTDSKPDDSKSNDSNSHPTADDSKPQS